LQRVERKAAYVNERNEGKSRNLKNTILFQGTSHLFLQLISFVSDDFAVRVLHARDLLLFNFVA